MNTDVLGYRAKIGVIVPATNTIAQPEYELFRPAGVTNHVARMPASHRQTLIDDMDSYERSLQPNFDGVKAAIRTLAPCRPSAILLGHSINSFWGGMEGAKEMAAEIGSLTDNVPVFLPSLALVAALKAIAPTARRLAILTPYFPPGDKLVSEFFEESGYEISSVIGLRFAHPLDIASRDAEALQRSLKALAESAPDAIVQPGTNLATAIVAAEAEPKLQIPILACNTASYWYCLRGLGIADKIEGFGSLLEQC